MAGSLLLERVDVRDNAVALVLSDGTTHIVAAAWLRESCCCGSCRYLETGRRRLEALATSSRLAPGRVSNGRTAVVIDWPDGHRSEIPVESVVAAVSRAQPTTITHWDAGSIENLPRFPYDEVVNDRQVERAWLETVQELGFAIVSGVPTTREALIRLAESVGPIRRSNYELVWSIEATVDPDNEVVSARELSPHTDLPYRQLPPGLQFLLSVVADAPGGASTLVDGYRIAEAIHTESPRHWQALTEATVRYRFVDASSDFELDAPVIALGVDGSYGVIRHAPGLIAPLDPTPSEFEPLYAALQHFTRLTNDPAFQVVHRLAPGDLLTFDNHRVLHGRQAFDLGAGGRRHLLGAYLDRDVLSSRLRVLGASQEWSRE